ncbi:MAG: tRNA pseudouridine(55) synthase TruB [bacterium]|nr:tRNA pseudouridine(55) synthase TruB [bacterium]
MNVENVNFNLENPSESGQILIDKPAGITSFGVVARVRRVLKQKLGKKKIKVGHTGTLDPFATGLLVLLYGKETKNAMNLTKLDKVYEAEFTLGQISSTGDPEGEISDCSDFKIPTLEQVQNEINRNFLGKIEQTPPAFSAIKVDGRRAYDLARKGADFEIPKRTVEIFSFEILDYNFPILKVRTHVSSGTYIRSLAEDLGYKLGCSAFCSKLRRIKIADFDISNAIELKDLGIKD